MAGDKREMLASLIAGLEAKHAQLLASVEPAPAREHAARLDALERNPGDPSDAKGAASPVRKIREQAVRDQARLVNVQLELAAARETIAKWDSAQADEARAVYARMDQARAAAEAAIVEEREGESGDCFRLRLLLARSWLSVVRTSGGAPCVQLGRAHDRLPGCFWVADSAAAQAGLAALEGSSP